MHLATGHARNRVAAVTAATVAGLALAAIPGPGYAAASPQPALSLTAVTTATIDTLGTPLGFQLANRGEAPATEVTVTYDGSRLTDDVVISLADTATGCQLAEKVVTCPHADLAPGQDDTVESIVLASRPNAAPGDAGDLTVVLAGTGPDGTATSSRLSVEVTKRPDPDLAVSVEDLGSTEEPVGSGETHPVRATIINRGRTEARDIRLTLTLPLGSTFVERYEECDYTGGRSGTPPDGYVYGPTTMRCVLPVSLPPGYLVRLFAPQGDEALFHVAVGANLPGPQRHTASVEVDAPAAAEPSDAARSTAAAEPSPLAERIAALPGDVEPWATPRSGPADGAELATRAEFAIWSKPNTHDFAVEAGAVTGAVGDTVEVAYTITNRGPSDGAATWWIVAPRGTVLLPSEWCSFTDEQGKPAAELTSVDCGTGQPWLAEASGAGTVSATIRLRITSTPGTNGSITVRPSGASTEKDEANNTVKIVINEPGGGGGELPITGARPGPTSGIGLTTVALGVLLLLLARRRPGTAVEE